MPTDQAMTPAKFIAKWTPVQLAERAASQEHFIDLCRMLGQPTPAEHDATGAEYTFEKGVAVSGPASKGTKGKRGIADVWWADKFGWEYKTKDKYRTLDDAYAQLLQYREALGNPPLLIVSDISRIEIHTNFTGTAKQKHSIALDQLTEGDNIAMLQRAFTDPYSFKPKLTLEQITREVAEDIGKLALSISKRGHDPHAVAHFLMKCTFCLFAEKVNLLPNNLFHDTLGQWHDDPPQLTGVLTDLFTKMRLGGPFGNARIDYFNGGLFDDSPALELTQPEIGTLLIAAGRDWSQVEPAIFGTLFERSLDPSKRSQIGAHYTSRDDILLIVEPVLMTPLRRRWTEVQAEVDKQIQRRQKVTTPQTRRKADHDIEDVLQGFMKELSEVRILDPACGSGNFLYVAIQQLLDLEKQVVTFAAQPEIALGLFPTVRPTQLLGLEINPFAAELAQVVIWIGYLQWMRANGFLVTRRPILDPLNTIECRDAILCWEDEKAHPLPEWRKGATCRGPAKWPTADYIIGNPPFLGSKLFREYGLGEEYIRALYDQYEIPNSSDLCCYWFERARQYIADHKAATAGRALRVGLLATQGIRGGENRETLKRIKNTGDIFYAHADRDWILDGAAVHVSMVGFDDGTESERSLNSQPVAQINSDLSGDMDLTVCVQLKENLGVYRRSPEKGGKFELSMELARKYLGAVNPNGRSNAEVMHPWINGEGLIGRETGKWIIDFPPDLSMAQAAQYEKPFAHLEKHVKQFRSTNRYESLRDHWWVHRRTGEGVRDAQKNMQRVLATTMTSKHRLFRFLNSNAMPDKGIPVFARSDDYFFGVLHSSIHELWARRMGTQLREVESGFRYTPTTCFETFALPWSPGEENESHPIFQRINEAAKELNEQREQWLNPPQWIDPIAQTVDRFDDFSDVPPVTRPLIRQSAIQAMAAKDARLKKRTLTNLYNQRPTWLKLAHEKLDRAVLAAYATVDPSGNWGENWASVWANTGAGQPLPAGDPLTQQRAEVVQKVLANLLRLNQHRPGAP